MTVVLRHARGFIVAVVVLLFTAGIALGAKALPTAASFGLETAAEAAGKAVPVRTGQADDEPAVPAEEGEDGEDGEDGEADAEEPETDETDGDAEGNHGSMVSQAAQMDTPEGFLNHGEWVSCVTHLLKLPVEEGAEPLTLEDIDKAACDAYDEARQASKDAAKEARDAKKAERQAERDAKKAERDAKKAERAAKRGGKHGG